MFKSVLSVSRCSRSLISSQRSVSPIVSRVSFSVTGTRQYSASSPKPNENTTTAPRPAPASGALNPTPWVNTSTTEPSASNSKAEPADPKFPLPPAPEVSNNILTDAEMKEYLVPLYARGWFVGLEENFVLKKSLKFKKDRDALDVLQVIWSHIWLRISTFTHDAIKPDATSNWKTSGLTALDIRLAYALESTYASYCASSGMIPKPTLKPKLERPESGAELERLSQQVTGKDTTSPPEVEVHATFPWGSNSSAL